MGYSMKSIYLTIADHEFAYRAAKKILIYLFEKAHLHSVLDSPCFDKDNKLSSLLYLIGK